MIVRGEGTLILDKVAYIRSVETILSGPAASAITCGGLSCLKDYVSIDIGATSTDIALVRNGYCKIDPEGAVIGGCRKRIRAQDNRTAGLAGYSRI